MYIHWPMKDDHLIPDNKIPRNLTIISLDGITKVDWVLPTEWMSGRPRLSPDRKTLALAGYGSIALMDVESGVVRFLDKTSGCYGRNSSSSWSPDGKYLAAACGENINVISISDGKIIQMGMNCLDGCLNVQWSPDGKWLLYGEGDYMFPKESGLFLIGTDCLVQPQTCFEQKQGPFSPNYGPPADFPGWSPDGKFLVIPGNSPGGKLVLEFLNVQTGAIERKMQPPNAFVFAIDAMAWSPDGEWIAYAQQLLNVDITRTQGGTPIELVNTPNELIKILQWISIPYPFALGSVYSITAAGANLNLRAQPALDGQVLKLLLTGEEITILEGPTLADGYTWWRMRAKDGTEGWAVDIPDWYIPQATATPSPTP